MMHTLSGLQAELLKHKIVMPLPWTELRTQAFCCGSCVGAELPLANQPKNTEGYVWFHEQSLDSMPELYLSWSLAGDFTHKQQVAFGYKLYWVFSQLGLSPEWNGETGLKIIITMLNYTEFEEWYAETHELDEEDDEEELDDWSYQRYVEENEEEHPEVEEDGDGEWGDK